MRSTWCKNVSVGLASLIGAGYLMLPTVGHADGSANKMKFAAGFDYSSGEYGGTQDTEVLFLPFTATYQTPSWTFKAMVPYLQIKGPGAVVGGADSPIVVGPGTAPITTESGLGDVVLSVAYLLPKSDALPYFELTGKSKLPTADEDKGLGTGKTDYSVQIDVFDTIGDLTPFATAGYRFRGDPTAFDLNDSFFASLGFGYAFDEAWSAGLIGDYREPSTDFSEEEVELVPYINWKIMDDLSFNLYGVFGMTDGSPETGVGGQLTYTVGN